MKGRYEVHRHRYQFPPQYEACLNLFAGPSLESELLADDLLPSGIVFETEARWEPFDREDLDFPVVFLKVVEPRGWVIMQDLETGNTILDLIS